MTAADGPTEFSRSVVCIARDLRRKILIAQVGNGHYQQDPTRAHACGRNVVAHHVHCQPADAGYCGDDGIGVTYEHVVSDLSQCHFLATSGAQDNGRLTTSHKGEHA